MARDEPMSGRLAGDLATVTEQELKKLLASLRTEHRDLDAAIARLAHDTACDELHLTRLKKRKLRLKDMIAYLENKLIPDLDA